MERVSSLFKFLCITALCTGVLLFACSKNSDTPPDEPPVTGDTSLARADTISARLLLMNAKKLSGRLPAGPSSSSLKVSFKDTLYLVAGVRIPINFLHTDTTKNVAGALVQIYSGGTASLHYFDVPEVPDIIPNDTVSMVLIGFGSDGVADAGVPPAGGEPLQIKIVPYDKNGNPLGDITRPVQISASENSVSGRCGLVNDHGDAWIWEYSYSLGQSAFEFFNSPYKVWGLIGQDIQGCCTNGMSQYTVNCESANKRKLNFQTFFNWPREKYVFFQNGTYGGVADYLAAVPAPDESNFCGNGPGVVHETFKTSFPEGTWSVNASRQLLMAGDAPVNTTARPDGTIFILNCRYLVVIRRTGDGGSSLAKFYWRQFPDTPYWFGV